MAGDEAVFLDRIEGPMAVLMREGGEAFEIPRTLLPQGSREGQWFRLGLEPDPERTEAEEKAVRARWERLARGDDGGDFSL
ncbi:MAG: DUF3006 domain-containing protein [Myxococcota bacterium]